MEIGEICWKTIVRAHTLYVERIVKNWICMKGRHLFCKLLACCLSKCEYIGGVTLTMLNLLKKTWKMYYRFLLLFTTEMAQAAEIISCESYDLVILHIQYHDCLWPGDARFQGINSDGINIVFPEYSCCSIRRVKCHNSRCSVAHGATKYCQSRP